MRTVWVLGLLAGMAVSAFAQKISLTPEMKELLDRDPVAFETAYPGTLQALESQRLAEERRQKDLIDRRSAPVEGAAGREAGFEEQVQDVESVLPGIHRAGTAAKEKTDEATREYLERFKLVKTDQGYRCLNSKGDPGWNRMLPELVTATGNPALECADLHSAAFQDLDLEGRNFAGANLRGASFGASRMRGASFSYADLSGAQMRDVVLSGAEMWETDLSHANLRRADLTDAALNDADLYRANLNQAVMGGASLKRASLGMAHLRNADLTGCDLREADLHGALLGHAKLDGANIGKADLTGADLRKASVENAVLESAFYDKDTKLPFGEPEAKRRGMIRVDEVKRTTAGTLYLFGQRQIAVARAVPVEESKDRPQYDARDAAEAANYEDEEPPSEEPSEASEAEKPPLLNAQGKPCMTYAVSKTTGEERCVDDDK